MLKKTILFCLLLLNFFAQAEADLQAEIENALANYNERSWELSIAAGYGVKTNPLVNHDDIPLYLVVNAAWFGQRLFFDNGDLGLMLHETEKWSLNIISHVNNERLIYEWMSESGFGAQFLELASGNIAASDPIPSNERVPTNIETEIELTDRSLAVDAGIELIYSDDWGDIQLQLLSDASFTHKGIEFWGSYGYQWSFQHLRIAPSIGFHWKSRLLLDYYYGVRDEEATPGRPAYTATSGLQGFFRLSASYQLSNHWAIVGLAEYETLSRSVRQSPLVERSDLATLFIGIMYNF